MNKEKHIESVKEGLVTVIIPTFKREKILRNALMSVKNQDLTMIDIIVVDDNIDEVDSKNVKDVCIRHNVRYVKNFRSKGGCGARNSGVLSTETKFVAFLDDDDFWLPGKLQAQCDFLNENEQYSAVYSGYYEYVPEYNLIWPSRTKKPLLHADLLEGQCPASSSIVVANRIDLMTAGLFDESLPSFQDYDMWLRLTCIKPMGYIDDRLAIFVHHHGDRVSVNLEKRFEGLDLIVSKWKNSIKRYKSIRRFRNDFKSAAYSANAAALVGRRYWTMLSYRALSVVYGGLKVLYLKELLNSLLGTRAFYKILKFRLRNTLEETAAIEEYVCSVNAQAENS